MPSHIVRKNQISTVYYDGNKLELSDDWQDKNLTSPSNKFYFVTDGEILISSEGKDYVVSKNEMILITSGTTHSYKLTSKKHATLYWFHFDVLNSEGLNLLANFNAPITINCEQEKKVVRLFEKIFKLSNNSTLLASLDLSAQINALVMLFLKHLPTQLAYVKNDSIDKVIQFISLHYTENFSLNDLASRSNYSLSQFCNIFKKRTGLSPIMYRNKLRLEQARFLLEQSSDKITSIMETVGFLDSAYFSKLFKKFYNVSPIKYRETYNKKTFFTINGNIISKKVRQQAELFIC